MSQLLYDNGTHKCIAFTDLVEGEGIQANQFLIVNNGAPFEKDIAYSAYLAYERTIQQHKADVAILLPALNLLRQWRAGLPGYASACCCPQADR